MPELEYYDILINKIFASPIKTLIFMRKCGIVKCLLKINLQGVTLSLNVVCWLATVGERIGGEILRRYGLANLLNR